MEADYEGMLEGDHVLTPQFPCSVLLPPFRVVRAKRQRPQRLLDLHESPWQCPGPKGGTMGHHVRFAGNTDWKYTLFDRSLIERADEGVV